MHEIISKRLWIGNSRDARDPSHLHEFGIEAIIDVAGQEPPASTSRDTIYCRFPLHDGDGNDESRILAAIQTTALCIRQQVPTLVACGAGMSRSPAVVAAALAVVEAASPDECLERVVRSRPHDVSPLLWAQVTSAYDKIVEANS